MQMQKVRGRAQIQSVQETKMEHSGDWDETDLAWWPICHNPPPQFVRDLLLKRNALICSVAVSSCNYLEKKLSFFI